jgi:membrane protein YdbS with pleckstrin-like domain
MSRVSTPPEDPALPVPAVPAEPGAASPLSPPAAAPTEGAAGPSTQPVLSLPEATTHQAAAPNTISAEPGVRADGPAAAPTPTGGSAGTPAAAAAEPTWALAIHPRLGTLWVVAAVVWSSLAWLAVATPLVVVLGVPLPGLVVVAGWALVATLAAAHARASFRRYRCELAPDGVRVCRGVFWQSEVFVPGARIQHTEVNQGPLDRRWGMAKLVLHTAGVHLGTLSLVGLRHGDAAWLRDRLLERQAGGAL